MKRFILAIAFVTGLSLLNSSTAQAQSVNISVNIGNQPAWGPVGYDYAGYYYFPDIDVYYDVNQLLFYYWDGRGWYASRYLPYHYNNYDLYGMYKVVINLPSPWRYHDRYRRQYAHFRGHRNQPIIMYSRDHRYDRVRNNRIVWINPDRSGRHPHGNYNGSYSSSRPNSNHRPDHRQPGRDNDKYLGNGHSNNGRPSHNSRPDHNRPNSNSRPDHRPDHKQPGKDNDKYLGNGHGNSNGNNTGRPSSNSRPDHNRPSNNSRPDSRPNNSRVSSNENNSVRSSSSGRSTRQQIENRDNGRSQNR